MSLPPTNSQTFTVREESIFGPLMVSFPMKTKLGSEQAKPAPNAAPCQCSQCTPETGGGGGRGHTHGDGTSAGGPAMAFLIPAPAAAPEEGACI